MAQERRMKKRGSNMNFAKTAMKQRVSGFAILALVCAVVLGTACNKAHNNSYKDAVKTALEQADLKDVRVTEDADKNTITLGGTVHSEDAKNRAANVAQANAGQRIIANEI